MTELIIDFERINKLTSTENDKPTEGYSGLYNFSISRKIIKEYVELFCQYYGYEKRGDLRTVTDKELNHVVETLKYNGILIDKPTIRDRKINDILE